MAELCDLCGVRPATVRARVTRNGDSETLNLCEVDYRRLAAQQRSSSPLESLFGGRGSLFDDFFGDTGGFFGGRAGDGQDRLPGDLPARAAARRIGEPEDRLSEHAKEILQSAAERAVQFGRREVDTEHLLFALTESDVVRTVMEQFKVSTDELRQQLEQESPRGDAGDEGGEIGVTPRVKSALGRAFAASHELGHSYVGPEHLLIGLGEEGEGIACDILRRYGLTPQALRQQDFAALHEAVKAAQRFGLPVQPLQTAAVDLLRILSTALEASTPDDVET